MTTFRERVQVYFGLGTIGAVVLAIMFTGCNTIPVDPDPAPIPVEPIPDPLPNPDPVVTNAPDPEPEPVPITNVYRQIKVEGDHFYHEH